MDTKTPALVIESIEARRKKLGITEVALSEETGIPLATLKRRLRNDNRMTLPEYYAITKALKMPAKA